MKHEEMTQQYSTWGDKLLQHADRLDEIQNERMLRPITVQLAPTEVCSSDCPFCSVAGRPVKTRMPWNVVEGVLRDFADLGAKSVEITGGGDPMLYSHSSHNINDVVELASVLGLDVGIITNSHSLKRIDPNLHRGIQWIRISLIQLDEGVEPEDYDFNGFPEERMGLSYIIYETDGTPDILSRTNRAYQGTTPETIQRLARLVELHPDVKFVRLAGDCLMQGNNKLVGEQWRPVIDEIDKWGKFFLKDIQDQDIPYDQACYMGAIRPYVAAHPKGGEYPPQVYVCTSHVLENRVYDLDYSLGNATNVPEIWERMNKNFRQLGYPYAVRSSPGCGWNVSCSHCFYQNNNRLLHTVATELPDKNFP